MTVGDIRSIPSLLTLVSTYIADENDAKGFRRWCGPLFPEWDEIIALNEEAAKPASPWQMVERLATRCSACFDRLALPSLLHERISSLEDVNPSLLSIDALTPLSSLGDLTTQFSQLRRLRLLPPPSDASDKPEMGTAGGLMLSLRGLEVLDLSAVPTTQIGYWMRVLAVVREAFPKLQKLSLGDTNGTLERDFVPFQGTPNLSTLHLFNAKTFVELGVLLCKSSLPWKKLVDVFVKISYPETLQQQTDFVHTMAMAQALKTKRPELRININWEIP